LISEPVRRRLDAAMSDVALIPLLVPGDE
jgi:hypothetical protein